MQKDNETKRELRVIRSKSAQQEELSKDAKRAVKAVKWNVRKNGWNGGDAA